VQAGSRGEMASFSFSMAEILRFAVVLMRVTGIMLCAPFFSGQSIPSQIRVVFALVTTLAMAPMLPLKSIPAGFQLSDIAPLFFSEVMFGFILGFAASLVFAGIQLAGQIISVQLGFSLINLIDPQTNVESSVFSFLQNYIALMFFLLMNGHHWFLLAINESFHTLPVGGIQLHAPLVEGLIHLSSEILAIGLRIAGPVIVVSLIGDVVMGILGRAAPQVNILIIGMPAKLLIGFACLSFSFYFMPRFFESTYSSLYKTVFSLIRMMI
jgi:flagellar biosynthesis protein FliR